VIETEKARQSAWGVLSGVRPTKLAHRLFDQGGQVATVAAGLTEHYRLQPAKAQMLAEIAAKQRAWLPPRGPSHSQIAIYIGIPFCPSRCWYCSFPGYPLPADESATAEFIHALIAEVREVGAAVHRAGVSIQTLYIGGGTPTSIPVALFRFFLREVVEHLLRPMTWEFTVEAGRPDTLGEELFGLMAALGVTRLSINPQTFHDRTLQQIGRKHSAQAVATAFAAARTAGFTNINMDLIVGLPGETADDIAASLQQVLDLEPDAVSLHSLARKRGSRCRLEQDTWRSLPYPEAVAILELLKARLHEYGYLPYYLYRQKNAVGDGENIGFARPGWECLYNIQVIEERQTIIGLGAGAGSKWVAAGAQSLTNTYNPQDPATYVKTIGRLIDQKIERIEAIQLRAAEREE